MPDIIKSLLLKSFSDYPFLVKETLGINDKGERQLFEVVIAFLLAQIRPDYQWKKGFSSDNDGLDFEAYKVIADFTESTNSEWDLSFPIKKIQFWIGGKSSQKKDKNHTIKAITNNLYRLGKLSPRYVVVAMIFIQDEDKIRKEIKLYEEENGVQILWIRSSEFEYLVKKYYTKIGAVFSVLEYEEQEIIYNYFYNLNIPFPLFNPTIEIIKKAPEEIGITRFFEFHCLIHFPFWFKNEVIINYIHESIINPVKDYSDIELLYPVALQKDKVLVMVPNEYGQISLKLKLRCSVIGIVDLGMLTIKSSDSDFETKVIPIGKIKVTNYVYHPPFVFNQINHDFLQSFDNTIDKALCGIQQMKIILGEGGVGKSRLSEQLGIKAQKRGFLFLNINQVLKEENQLSLISDIISMLVTEKSGIGARGTHDFIKLYFKQLLPQDNRDKLLSAIDKLFNVYNEASSNYSQEILNTEQYHESLSQLLFSIIVETLDFTSICIHLGNLHSTGSENLSIISRVIELLSRLNYDQTERIGTKYPSPRVIWILEGRNNENISDKRHRNYELINSWESFYNQFLGSIFELKPMTKEDSLAFIKRIFKNAPEQDHRLGDEFKIRTVELIDLIQKKSVGNPFHILEQIRYLIDNQRIYVDSYNYLFLNDANQPFLENEIPDNIKNLIQLRFSYFFDQGNDFKKAMLLIKGIGLLREQVPISLYNYFINSLGGKEIHEKVRKSQFLSLSKESVRFRHENYFNAFQSFANDKVSSLASIYLDWLESNNLEEGKQITLQKKLDICILRSYSGNQFDIKNELKYLAEDSFSKNEFSTTRESYEALFDLYGTDVEAILSSYANQVQEILWLCNNKIKYAEMLTWISNWHRSVDIYKEVYTLSKAAEKTIGGDAKSKLSIIKHSVSAEIGNVQKHTLRTIESLRTLQEAKEAFSLEFQQTDELSRHFLTDRVFLRIHNRLSLTFRFTGYLLQAIDCLEKVKRIICKEPEYQHQYSACLRDLGMTLVHIPERFNEGVNILKQGEQLLMQMEKEGTSFPLRELYLIQLNLLMTDLMALKLDKKLYTKDIEPILSKALEIYSDSEAKSFTGEKAEAAEIIGICYVLKYSGPSNQTNYWFNHAVSIAERTKRLQLAWRARYNYAQYCLLIGNKLAASHHFSMSLHHIHHEFEEHNRVRTELDKRHLFLNPYFQSIYKHLRDNRIDYKLMKKYDRLIQENQAVFSRWKPERKKLISEVGQPLNISFQQTTFILKE